jgi:hypothetical protein
MKFQLFNTGRFLIILFLFQLEIIEKCLLLLNMAPKTPIRTYKDHFKHKDQA